MKVSSAGGKLIEGCGGRNGVFSGQGPANAFIYKASGGRRVTIVLSTATTAPWTDSDGRWRAAEEPEQERDENGWVHSVCYRRSKLHSDL